MDYNSFHTIKSFTEHKLKEKGSIFIGQAFPLFDSENPEVLLKQVKKKYFDATHHCYAYKINNEIFKYSDAGEPSGTAGIRILNAIDHFKLEKILLVVIRYFGGTKLGVGPLGKAYYNSALNTLEKAEIVLKEPYKKLIINIDISFISQLYKIASENKGKVVSNGAENNSYEIIIPLSSEESFKNQIIKDSKGKITFLESNVIFFK